MTVIHLHLHVASSDSKNINTTHKQPLPTGKLKMDVNRQQNKVDQGIRNEKRVTIE